ncbi:MAG: zinc ribbon domain-containing protein [Coriobacteriia bacterium]|nr:zinc ribbon domain-containing protein [Coriobacteriia bacterium]
MSVGQTIQNARKKAGLTQEQLAAKVFVTRQAVSRWEMGESEPGIDMRKLLASILNVPVAELLDLPDAPTCQCCGTPFDVPNMPFGTNADGTENPDYCGWCYKNGQFTGASLDETIERNVPYLMEATGYTAEEAVSFMGAVLPTLKHWNTAERHDKSANLMRSTFYVCPNCLNVIWSTDAAMVTCCGAPLEALEPTNNAGTLAATVEVADGCQRIHVAHPMTGQDHLSFIAAVSNNLVQIKRLSPKQEAYAEFPLQGPCRLYAYGPDCGLVEL